MWKNLDGISGCHILGLKKARNMCLILPMVSWERYPKGGREKDARLSGGRIFSGESLHLYSGRGGKNRK